MNRGSLVGVASLLAVLSAACGDVSDAPLVAPATDISMLNVIGSTSALVDAVGADLANLESKLVVPAGALAVPVQITMELKEEDGHRVCEFAPHGLQFSQPAVLSFEIPANASVSDEFSIEWFNPATNSWTELGGTTVGNRVQVELDHFSKYRANFDRIS